MANVINFDISDNRVEYRLGKSDRTILIDTGDINLPVRLSAAMDSLNSYFTKMNNKFGVKTLEDIDKVKTGNVEDDVALLKQTDIEIGRAHV